MAPIKSIRGAFVKGTLDCVPAAFGFTAAILLAAPAVAEIAFTGVAAGDPSSDDAILWTRTVNAASGQPVAAELTVQLAAEPDFRAILSTYKGRSDPVRDGTVKIDATGLQPHQRYFYRFATGEGAVSPTGRFATAPGENERVAVRFGFSGDAHGAWRPYPVVRGIADREFDYFVWLGDTMYETASNGSPAAADPFANPVQALTDYRRKYLENILPVKPGGFPSLQPMFAAQGNYTLLDNHELGNKQFQSGGAPAGEPPGKGVDATDVKNDVTAGCDMMNRAPGFTAVLQAYLDFQPVRERRVGAPGDCRSDGTWQLYFAQRWGANTIFINVDDRSYRDIRLQKPNGGDDTGPRADGPSRTMLGATQLAWLERVLVDAQQQGVTWKIVAISSPIDQIGQINGSDGGKSWIGGYRAERNRLLKFIAEQHIEHVLFLTTDDHQNRVIGLYYPADPNAKDSRTPVPGAFTIVAGPLGAGGPDRFSEHGYALAAREAEHLVAVEHAAGIEPIGLRPDFPGLKQVVREGHPEADAVRGAADFYSPDTFNFVTLEISADGKSLSVETWGIDSYAANRFPEPDEVGAPRRLLAFRIEAG